MKYFPEVISSPLCPPGKAFIINKKAVGIEDDEGDLFVVQDEIVAQALRKMQALMLFGLDDSEA